MTNTELKEEIDITITSETAPSSITPTDVGNTLKLMVDYVDQQAPSLDSGSITLNGTFQVLPKIINSCAFAGGKAFLPDTTIVGKQYYVIAVSNNIEIRANSTGSNKMFVTFNTFVSSVTLLTNEMYRFTYIGFGTGTGGVVDGYWKAELLQ